MSNTEVKKRAAKTESETDEEILSPEGEDENPEPEELEDETLDEGMVPTKDIFVPSTYRVNETTVIPYEDRELSWIKFNRRVLDLVSNPSVPLLERVKFLAITNSNLDEFFAIRVASRLQEIEMLESRFIVKPIISKIIRECNLLASDMDREYLHMVSLLKEHGIIVHGPVSEDVEAFQYDKIRKHFINNVKPALTPLLLDSTRPLPHIKPFCLYIASIIKTIDGERIGLIEIPSQLDRLVYFQKHGWYFIEDIIISQLEQLYPGLECSDVSSFRLLRDGDTVTETEDAGYVESMMKHVRSRILYNDPVRLEIYGTKSKKISKILRSSLKIKKKLISRASARLKVADIMQLYGATDIAKYKYPSFKPAPVAVDESSFMELIEDKDLIVHHPYESFNDTVLRLIKEACLDPHVISIKQTLYRSGEDSKILKHLLHAAEIGKNVVVVMELKARFDEENNIEWAEKLQKAGAIVVYGYEQIKTHAKLIHIFRKDGKKITQYAHIGTGNYSEKNSKIYTDFSYFTTNTKICSDVNSVFNTLTGGYTSDKIHYNKIYVAPTDIRPTLYTLIDDEIAKGKDGYIAIKVNNISDHALVAKLYEASQSGVRINIICRGSCSLIAGVPGFSDTISVTSIVGRFLEHSRVLVFGIGSSSRVFITSSDMMTRNLDRRVEILFEITPPKLKNYLQEYVSTMLMDNTNSYSMGCSGIYIKNIGEFDSQQFLIMKHADASTRLGE